MRCRKGGHIGVERGRKGVEGGGRKGVEGRGRKDVEGGEKERGEDCRRRE